MSKERDYEKFFTYPVTAKFMVSLLSPKSGDAILEPSAGKGNLVRAVKEISAGSIVFAFEVNPEYKSYLRNAGANIVVIKDFLEVPVYAKFTSCIANPPFGNETNLQDHFTHICNHVKVGGKVVMIVPDDFEPNVEHKKYPLENWSKNSDGTTTQIKIIEFINE